MDEFDDILLETPNMDIDNIINDQNSINPNYDKLKQELSAIRDKSIIQIIDRSYCSLDKLEGNTFNEFFQLIDLDLSHNVLMSLPKGVFNQLFNIQTINLSHNLITELQDLMFKNNKKLKTINLSNNFLNKINSRAFYNLSTLRKLNFSYNRIEKLEERCVDSESLRKLNLSNNQIIYIPNAVFLSVPNLINLQLNNNKISYLNENMFKSTTKIEILNLSHNLIQKLYVKTFANLNNLKEVDLSNNLLWTCGNCFENKPMLHELNLLNNNLRNFRTTTIFVNKDIRTLKLTIHELQKLDRLKNFKLLSNFELHVQTNQIFKLYQSVFYWINRLTIQRLYIVIQKGNLDTENKILYFYNLEFLHVEFLDSNNCVDAFNLLDNINAMTKLKHLALININKLRITGNDTINETNLTYLDLTGIDNVSVDFLKNNFVMLEHLNLSFSNVESISRDLMSTLPYLKFLNMNSTRISVIVDRLFQYNNNLEIILFKNCQIHTIGENAFRNLMNLKEIDIRGNIQLRITQSLLNGIPKSAIVFFD